MATADTAAVDSLPPGAGEAALETPATPSVFDQIRDNFNQLSQRQKLAGAAALAFAVALIVGLMLWTREPEYAVLFSNIEERDGGEIIAALTQQNVPYRFSAGGQTILVPSAQVHDARLRLAAQGLPKGGMVGFELMETARLGMSQFHEQVNYQRALEGELSRTVQAISSVANARVHLAMPRQTAFLRDEQRPTASVMVHLRPGRFLNQAQVAGIVHLVASSVPRMINENVSIVDQNGQLLTQKDDREDRSLLDPNQLRYIDEVEASYVRRVENILNAMFGPGNFRAQVAAEVDFNQTEQTAETFRPNPSPDQAIRSQQTNEYQTRDGGPMGVPGALTNQPPVPAIAPIVQPPVLGPNGEAGVVASRGAVINYEVDRTIQHVKQSVGQVRRISAAVAVNHRIETLPNGQTRSVALTDEEIARVTELVRDAVGFNAQRGDSVSVVTSNFAPAAEEEAVPLWKDPLVIELSMEAMKYLPLVIAVLLAWFGVIRPLIRTVLPPPPPPAEEESAREPGADEDDEDDDEDMEGEEDDDDVLVSLSGEGIPDDFDARIAQARELARNHPKVVANLIREWMGVNEEGRK